MERQFKKTISSNEINQSVIDDFYSGAVSMYISQTVMKKLYTDLASCLTRICTAGRRDPGIEDAQGEKLDPFQRYVMASPRSCV